MSIKTLTKERRREIVDRLTDIQSEIEQLLEEIDELLKDTNEYDRAKRCWMAHIEMAIFKETKWLGKSMTTMDETIHDIEYEDMDS